MKLLSVILGILLTTSAPAGAQGQEVKEFDVSGIPVRVFWEYKGGDQIQFLRAYIPDGQYSKENLLAIWRYFCAKYPDKSDRPTGRIFGRSLDARTLPCAGSLQW